jgi:hypothetical protein
MYYGTPPIVTNGLVLNLDPANSLSIPVDPTVNLIGSNPIPVNNTSSYQFVLAWNITGSYNATSQSIEFNILNAPSGWVVNNTSLNTTVLDTGSLYTISFEWKIEPDSTSLCRIWPQIATGNNATRSFEGVIRNSGSATYTTNNTLLPDGFYKYIATFRPSNPGVNGNRSFRFLGGEVTGGQTLRMHWRKLQLERVPYATTFVSGSRNSWGSVPTATYSASLLNTAITGGIPYFSSPTDRVLNFDGTGSFAQMTGSTYTNFGSGSFAFTTWIRRTDDDGFIFGSQNTDSFVMYQNFGNLAYGRGNVGLDGTFTNTNFPLDRWTYLAMVKSNNTMSLYSNGILMQQQPNTSSYVQGGPNFIIGKNPGSDITFFAGQIGDYKIYNRALSQAEITQNYNAYKSRYGLT